jgi:Methyltransferase domain
MDDLNRKIFGDLPRLDIRQVKAPVCKVCAAESALFDAVDFYKHCSGQPYQFGLSGVLVPYYRCPRCSFIFTDLIDNWTADDVSRFIYNSDYIKVDPEYLGARALRIAALMANALAGCEDLRILDYGSGSGVFSAEMARRGFKHVQGYDPFSSPCKPSGLFDLITCFEVIEHSPQPLETFNEMFNSLTNDGAIIIGQSFQPANIEEIGTRWWYVGPRNGHVSIFAEETFIALANRANLIYYRGDGFYVLRKGEQLGAARETVKGIGLPVHLRTLVSPNNNNPEKEWHGVERMDSTAFRWSANDNLRWRDVSFRRGTTLIQIPFIMEIPNGLAMQCKLIVDGKELPTRVERHRIIGEITYTVPQTREVALRTPALKTPMEVLGTTDTRRLGLAVPCW